MTTKHTTRRALLSSALSLFLCVVMLMGTTFAWFTDSVTSANNVITSGNLDIELEYWNGTDWKDVKDASDILTNTLWEPGATEVAYLRIANAGSLALKYQLGVNIVSETAGINAKGESFKLSDYIQFGIVEDVNAETNAYATREDAVAAVTTAQNISAGYTKNSSMASGDELYLALVVFMPTTVGDDANHNGINIPAINLGINVFATQVAYEEDSFDENYDADAMTFVSTPEEAQAALDNATAGTIIKLASGVDYGTLYIRPVDGSPATKIVDWIGNNYRYETYSLFEDLTIIGAPGATVDAIKIEGGTYYNTEHSQSDQYPVMLSLVELKNVVIDGVTFTGNGGYDPQGHGNAINLSGNNIKVNGLTLKNCELKNESNNARLIYKTESTTTVHTYAYGGETFTFSPTLKNITITDCTFNGGYIGLELRETENLTITNNIFNVDDRNILLPVNTGCTYSGTVTITGNVSNNAKERFVRADGMGDAVVIITDNTISNYMGTDTDYIKVTNGNNVTIENNTITRKYVVSTVDELKAALNAVNDGDTIALAAVDFGGVDLVNTTNNGHRYSYADYTVKNLTIVGQPGTTFTGLRFGENDDKTLVMTGWTLKDITFTTGNGLIFGMNNKDVTVEGCTFINTELQNTGSNSNTATNFTVKNCTFNGSHATRKTQLAMQSSNGLTVTGCTFINAAHNAMNIAETYGDVVIENNTVQGTADRALRFTISDANVTLTIKNNTIVSDGDDDGQLLKANGTGSVIVTADNVILTDNTWNGKTDSQVSAGKVGSDYIVK